MNKNNAIPVFAGSRQLVYKDDVTNIVTEILNQYGFSILNNFVIHWNMNTLIETVRFNPSSKEVLVSYNVTRVTESIINNNTQFIGGIDGIGKYNINNIKLGQYIVTAKIHDSSNILTCYQITNNKNIIVYPDIVQYQNCSYISYVLDDLTTITNWLIYSINNIN